MSKFKKAHKAFQAVQEEYSDFGAWDTEPRCVFYELIESVHKGIDPAIPATVNGWQLYDIPGAKKAAKALAKAARAAVKAAKGDAIGTAQFLQ